VKSVDSNNTKAIDSWIKNISALQKNKPTQAVNYQRAMPSIESLMQIWPQEYEDLLKELSLPSSELNVDLNTYVDIICALLDIPVYKSRIQSIHVLFSLFSEFKNSQVGFSNYKYSQFYSYLKMPVLFQSNSRIKRWAATRRVTTEAASPMAARVGARATELIDS
jgi:hypothetical protein